MILVAGFLILPMKTLNLVLGAIELKLIISTYVGTDVLDDLLNLQPSVLPAIGVTKPAPVSK